MSLSSSPSILSSISPTSSPPVSLLRKPPYQNFCHLDQLFLVYLRPHSKAPFLSPLSPPSQRSFSLPPLPPLSPFVSSPCFCFSLGAPGRGPGGGGGEVWPRGRGPSGRHFFVEILRWPIFFGWPSVFAWPRGTGRG